MNQTSTKSGESLHPILSLVKPQYRSQFNLPLVLYILEHRKKGLSYARISQHYFAETGISVSPSRIANVCKRYAEGMKYV